MNFIDSKSSSLDRELAILSRASYPDYYFKDSFEVIDINNKETDTQAYLVIDHNRKLAVLVFRGTQKNGKDILTDIKFGKEKYQGAWLHIGFLTAYLSIKVQADLETSKIPRGYRFYLTGHSLGGSLACLQALYGKTPFDKLVTFGQPRIGQSDTADKLSKLHYSRYVNHADIVPRIPKINYYHGGELIYLNKKGDKVYNPSKWYMFKDRLIYLIHRFTDHKINEYIQRGSQ